MTKIIAYMPAFLRQKLEKHSGLSKIIENFGWLFIDKILVMMVGMVVMIWMANYLGEANYGKYNYGRAFLEFFVVIATLGFDSLIVRDMVKMPEMRGRLMGTSFGLRLVGGVLMLLTSYLVIVLLRPEDTLMHVIIVVFASAYLFKALDVIDLWFQAEVQSKYAVWARNGAFLLITGVKIYLIMSKAPLLAFVAAEVVMDALIVLGLWLMYRYTGESLRSWKFDWSLGKRLLREGAPLSLSTIMIVIYMKVDQVMIGEMIADNDKSVGIYSMAAKFSEIFYFIPMILGSSFFPALIKSKELGDKVYHDRFQSFFDLNSGIAMLISLPASLLAPVVFFWLFKGKYAGADAMFAIHIWGSIFVFLGVARNRYLINEGLLKESFWFTIAGAVVNVGLNLWLIPKYQGYGAALATLASYMVSGYLTSFMLPRLHRIAWMQTKSLLIPFTFWKYLKKNHEL